MVDRDNPVTVYLSDRELQQVKEWADTNGKSQSQLLRDAIMEYTDKDRSARIEDKLDRVLARLDDADAHTHKADPGMKQGSPAVEKAREIIRRLQRECENPDGILQTDAVDRAIEDIAGADSRTLRKYKRIFRRRGLLFAHPGENPLWSLQSDQWLTWMEDYARLNGTDDAREVSEPYPATVTATDNGTYVELAEVDE